MPKPKTRQHEILEKVEKCFENVLACLMEEGVTLNYTEPKTTGKGNSQGSYIPLIPQTKPSDLTFNLVRALVNTYAAGSGGIGENVRNNMAFRARDKIVKKHKLINVKNPVETRGNVGEQTKIAFKGLATLVSEGYDLEVQEGGRWYFGCRFCHGEYGRSQ